MRKLTQSSDWHSETTPPFVGTLDSRVTQLMKHGQALGVNSRVILTVGALLFTGLMGWAQMHAPRGLNFEYFYLFACTLVGWFAGARGAFVCAVAAATLTLLSELGSQSALPLWIVFCNVLVRLPAFLSIGWLAAEVGRSTRDLREAVERRTASLQQVVGEHKLTSEMLSEATQMFRQVAENITDVFWVTDPVKTKFEYISPEFEELWGRACQTLYASPSLWIEGIHHEDRERVTRAMLSKQVTGEYDEEYRVVRPDGSLRWVHDRAFPVRDEQGAVYRLVGIAEDITERKRTEHLLQAERDVGVALGATSDLKFALDRLLDVAVQLEGIDCGGAYLADVETGELHLAAHRGLSGSFLARVSHYRADTTEARLVKSGKNIYMRQDQIPRNLEVLWGSEGLRALAVVPVQHNGSVLGVLNLASYRHDEIVPRTRVRIEMIASQVAAAIARIRAEESLRRSETQLRTIVNSAPIALIATDAKGTITFEDGQALGVMGARPGEHLRQQADEVYSSFPLIQENVRRGLKGEEFNSVLEFDSRVLECRYKPVRDSQKEVIGLITVAIDVTERLQLQREILEISDREQARIGQDIHDGLCQQLIGLAICANGLEQSLAGQGMSETETARKICKLLDEAITEARGVCQGLYPIRLRTEGLPPALRELASGVAERHGIRCVAELQDDNLRCDRAIATHLYRIAQEAVNNAAKHSGARQIIIRLGRAHGEIMLEIRDDGRWRAGAPTRNSGMGMHIMDYRAQLIGGILQCHGGENGTIISCRVPHSGAALKEGVSGTISDHAALS